MSTQTQHGFAEIAEQVEDWMTTDDLVALCDEQGYWPDDYEAEALLNRKRADVRRLARKKWTDGRGQTHELVSILRTDVVSDPQARAYKQLALLDAGDFVQVVRDRMDRSEYFRQEAERYARMAIAKFGRKVADLLPLKFEDDAS